MLKNLLENPNLTAGSLTREIRIHTNLTLREAKHLGTLIMYRFYKWARDTEVVVGK